MLAPDYIGNLWRAEHSHSTREVGKPNFFGIDPFAYERNPVPAVHSKTAQSVHRPEVRHAARGSASVEHWHSRPHATSSHVTHITFSHSAFSSSAFTHNTFTHVPVEQKQDGFARHQPVGAAQEHLADASAEVAREMHTTFKCAAGVGAALDKIGLGRFQHCGDAWDLGSVLRNSGLFEVIPESEARRGDIGVQAWSKQTIEAYFDKYHGRNLGDIFVVQSNNSGQISQSNDHVQQFRDWDRQYDPNRRYFLRLRDNVV